MTSCRLVAEAIATARKLRDAPNNGDAARHGVDVAAHVLDVTRSGAASAGAAKARHARAGAPLVVRVVLLALLAIALLHVGSSQAHVYTITASGNPLNTSDRSCASYKAVVTAYVQANGYPTLTANSCSNDPVVVGSVITFSNTGTWTISSITAQCSTGYTWNSSTLNCDPLPSVVCSPSFKTVSPCPTGYAPKEVTVQTSQQPDAYQTTLDAMPLQEMLYALCIGIAGLLGFSVGVRLV